MMLFRPYGVKQLLIEKKINFVSRYPRVTKTLENICTVICIVLIVAIVFGLVFISMMSTLSDPSGNGG